MSAARTHWSKMPPVQGFTRVEDNIDVDRLGRAHYRRMLRCDLCGDTIPSLGVGYHKQGRSCVERKAEREAREGRRAAQAAEALAPPELAPEPEEQPLLVLVADQLHADDRLFGFGSSEFDPPLVVLSEPRPCDEWTSLVLVDDGGRSAASPHRYLDRSTLLRVERRAS